MEDKLTKTTEELLQELDSFEDNIKLIDKLTKQYNSIKSEIKKAMVKVGKDNNLEQIKWTTPNGTKITCSIGHIAQIEKKKTIFFNELKLKNEYPEVYQACCEEKEMGVIVKNATNDTLRITLGKDDE